MPVRLVRQLARPRDCRSNITLLARPIPWSRSCWAGNPPQGNSLGRAWNATSQAVTGSIRRKLSLMETQKTGGTQATGPCLSASYLALVLKALVPLRRRTPVLRTPSAWSRVQYFGTPARTRSSSTFPPSDRQAAGKVTASIRTSSTPTMWESALERALRSTNAFGGPSAHRRTQTSVFCGSPTGEGKVRVVGSQQPRHVLPPLYLTTSSR
mmetsp:Transcript_16140/g.34900  ORF Transcript_16140/g.34900 Transcript_16140/m.34900 type:complete len:211 (+) Transcript_16140:185-817(+)